MTRNEIIEMATQAGLCYTLGNYEDWIDAGPAGMELEKFAKLVAAHEREECAKLCEKVAAHYEFVHDSSAEKGADLCFAFIHSRSKA